MEFFEFANSALYVFFASGYEDGVAAFSYAMLTGGLVFLIVYAFQAFALYTIAVREGYGKKWMAFVPVFNTYYVGVCAQKNKVRNVSVTKFSLAQAIVETVLVVLYVLYFVSAFLMFRGNYAVPVYESKPLYDNEILYFTGYNVWSADAMPNGLLWARWMFLYMEDCFIFWLNLVYILLGVFVVIAFFQTYACRRYFLFSLLAVFFSPIKGILFFAVRNNKGKNYLEYVREQRARQYRMYQEYTRQNMNNPYNYNPYSGRNQPNPSDDPYRSAPQGAEDPFSEFGDGNGNGGNSADGNSSGGGSSYGGEDPFDEFN